MMLAALVHGVAHLLTETGRSNIRCVGRNQSPVEPGRAIGPDLTFQIEGRDDPNAGLPVAACIIGGGAALEILGDSPLIGVVPLDAPGAAQRLQPAHMGLDDAPLLAPRTTAPKPRHFQLP